MRRTRAFTLRSYPFKEHDRVVTFFTEELGIVRGVARGSLKMKSKIAGALEPLTFVNLRFVASHGKELVIVTGCDAITSLYHEMDNLALAAATSLITEITQASHADYDADVDFFRLLILAQKALKNDVSPAVVSRYFELFTLKLTGVLPPLEDIRSPEARALMQKMLRTNLLELAVKDEKTLNILGQYLRRNMRDVLGKTLKSYIFADQFRSANFN
jgi:DNA repair protein RecO